jgi:hypothetical protein
VQICSDFGIWPDHPLWREIVDMVEEFRGPLGTIVNECQDPAGFWCNGPLVAEQPPAPSQQQPQPQQPQQPAATYTTGPPPASLAA